jgi:tetratricopeptide (TPR) repeat protein
MPNHLPKAKAHVKALASAAKLKASQFPNIFRFITEKASIHGKYLRLLRLSVSGIISVLLLGITISQSLQLQNNLRQEKKLAQERKNIEKEIKYWGKTAEKYTNYTDIYLKIASLEYRLGNSQTAQTFIDKALAINPDTEQGRVLGEKISRK